MNLGVSNSKGYFSRSLNGDKFMGFVNKNWCIQEEAVL